MLENIGSSSCVTGNNRPNCGHSALPSHSGRWLMLSSQRRLVAEGRRSLLGGVVCPDFQSSFVRFGGYANDRSAQNIDCGYGSAGGVAAIVSFSPDRREGAR